MFGKDINEVTVQELKKINNRKTKIIDVREPEEFESMHIPNANNVPLKVLLNSPEEFIDGPVYIICANGKRSKKAVKKLSKNFEVYNVTGGTNSYGHFFALVRTQKIVIDKKTKK